MCPYCRCRCTSSNTPVKQSIQVSNSGAVAKLACCRNLMCAGSSICSVMPWPGTLNPSTRSAVRRLARLSICQRKARHTNDVCLIQRRKGRKKADKILQICRRGRTMDWTADESQRQSHPSGHTHAEDCDRQRCAFACFQDLRDKQWCKPLVDPLEWLVTEPQSFDKDLQAIPWSGGII